VHNQIKALEMAIEAIEKQIPTKPIMRNWCPALCPNCKDELSEHKRDGYYKHHYNLCSFVLNFSYLSIHRSNKDDHME
jgi:hypothetical protein